MCVGRARNLPQLEKEHNLDSSMCRSPGDWISSTKIEEHGASLSSS